MQLHCECRKAAPLNLMITVQAIYDCIKTSPDLNSELLQYKRILFNTNVYLKLLERVKAFMPYP